MLDYYRDGNVYYKNIGLKLNIKCDIIIHIIMIKLVIV